MKQSREKYMETNAPTSNTQNPKSQGRIPSRPTQCNHRPDSGRGGGAPIAIFPLQPNFFTSSKSSLGGGGRTSSVPRLFGFLAPVSPFGPKFNTSLCVTCAVFTVMPFSGGASFDVALLEPNLSTSGGGYDLDYSGC